MAETKTTVKKSKKPNAFVGFFKRISSYLRSCVGEVKKITWTSPKTTTRNFFIVILVCLVVGLFLFGLDRGLYALLELVMDTAGSTAETVAETVAETAANVAG